MRLSAALSIALLLSSPAAYAADIAANTGTIEVVGEPGSDHLGVYPYAAVSTLFPVGKAAVIPSIGVEWSPEFGRWGFVGTVTADYGISSRIGVDLNVAFIHDQQDHHWSAATYLAGGGPGISIYVTKQWTVSPYVNVFRALNASGGSIVPGVNLAFAL